MKNSYYIILLVLLAFSCGKKEEVKDVAPPSGDTLVISDAQYKAAGVEFGTIEKKPVKKVIKLNGVLDVPPQNLISVSPPLGGFVKSTKLLEGMKVRKGDLLVTLENPEYIQLQQDYLDRSSRLEFLKEEFVRQEELAKESINAGKALQQARSQYQSEKAIVQGLESKLRLLGIDPSQLAGGKISSTITMHSPVNGYVSAVNVNIGKFASSADVMFRIVNLEHVHAELQAYEKDISSIKIGQRVQVSLTNEAAPRGAEVYLIGKELSAERTIRVHCHLDKEDESLIPGMYITGLVETQSTDAETLPVSAIVNFEGANLIFVLIGKNTFRAVPVNIGDASGDYLEVLPGQSFDRQSKIVVKGAFELLGLLKNTEE
jgi:membrane fusion protein, heavy metal efflux system